MSGWWTRLRASWWRFWQRARPHGVRLPPQPTLDLHPSVGPEVAADWVDHALHPGQTQAVMRRAALARSLAPQLRPCIAPLPLDLQHPAAAAARELDLRRLTTVAVAGPAAPQIRGLRPPSVSTAAPNHDDWTHARAACAPQEPQ